MTLELGGTERSGSQRLLSPYRHPVPHCTEIFLVHLDKHALIELIDLPLHVSADPDLG